MSTLLSHLARWGGLSKYGELLCTQSLAYLLRDDAANQVWTAMLSSRTGLNFRARLVWRAEATQADGGRPDLEGISPDGTLIKVEAKLGHTLSTEQLTSYGDDLIGRSQRGALVILVPAYRIDEAERLIRTEFCTSEAEDQPWRLHGQPAMGVLAVSWEDVWSTLTAAAETADSQRDIATVKTLYLGLTGLDFAPLACRADLQRWRERKDDIHLCVDRITRQLSEDAVMPFGVEATVTPPQVDPESSGYRRRYLSRRLADARVNFCIGSRDPFAGFDTPVWLRFHRTTAGFAMVLDRLQRSPWAARMVLDGGHIWLPLDIPERVDGPAMVAAMVAQARQMMAVVFAVSSA